MVYKGILQKPYHLLIIAFIIVSFLLSMILRYEKVIEKDIFKIATNDLLHIARNYSLYIKDVLKDSNSYVNDIKADKKLRENLEKNIKNLITDNIKYIYLLYKDKNDVFRFLVDGSPEEEKSMLNQKFDVVNDKWFELYTAKQPILIKHTLLQRLSITYLVPVVYKGNVELVLVVDFSIETIREINDIITMIKSGLIFLLVFILVSLALFFIQYIKYNSMKKSSFTDKLTNLYNRNYLHDIQDKIKLNEYVIAVLDIDHFKTINDTYGHGIGDTVLKEFGDILLHTIRIDEDIAIRYGGEEFIVFIKRKSIDSEIPFQVIDRMFSNIKNHKMYINSEKYINVTVSIGVNKSPEKSKNFLEAFKVADSALYDAKNSGRDKIEID